MRRTINVWGCLLFVHCSIAESHMGYTLNVEEKRAVYRDLLKIHAGNQYRGMKPSCYILNHEDSINQALDVLGSSDHAHYVFIDRGDGEIIYPYDHSREYEGLVNARAEQWKVAGSHSHFIHTELDGTVVYDPYPQLSLTHRMSIRGYHVG